MKKIFVNARFLTQNITGVQRYAIEISKELKKNYPNIKFVAPKNIIHGALAEYLEVETYGRLAGHLWEQIELPIYLRKQGDPLLVNLANLPPLIYKNKICTIHDLSFLRNPQWFSRKYYYYYRFMTPKIAKTCKKIITVSEFSKNEIIKLLNISNEKIINIYNSNSDTFKSIPSSKPKNNYEDYILAVSSANPRKNFKNLILAFNKLQPRKIKLLIVGSDNKVFASTGLNKLVNMNSNIIFTGYMSDIELAKLYTGAKLFVYPSLYEGFGIPPLEAMACGCPVVVSNTASLPEVCGEAAYYINPYNVDDIAKGIGIVLNDSKLQQELRQKGFDRVKLFSWEKSAKKIMKLINDLEG